MQPDESAIARGLEMAEENQWETIVGKLEGHIADVFAKKEPRARATAGEVTIAAA